MPNYPFASRTNWSQESNTLNKSLESMAAQGIKVLDLTASNPTECGFSYPKDILSAFNSPKNFHYTPDAKGLSDARRSVAQYYAHQGTLIPEQDIILTASTSEAYSFLLRLLVNPGERVLIPRPSYPLFQFLLEINDVAFDYYPLEYNGQWQINRQALEAAITDKTRAIILVNPNNPTGSYIHQGELDFLNQLCQKHQMAIISDEVFFDYAWGPSDYVSCLGNQSALTFTLGGLSKTMALPQMKCAWMLASGPQDLLKESLSRLEIIADTYLSVNTPVQNALSSWFESAPALQKQINQRVKDNWQWLKTHVSKHAQVLSVQGGWYAVMRIPAVKTEEEWVLEFLQQDYVLVHPGYFFDFDQEAYMIVSLLPLPNIFQDAAGRIMRRLDKL